MIVERGMPEEITMNDLERGQFSLSLKSLQLQLQTLLEDAGGERVVELLDSLCRLNSVEQHLVLGVFSRLLERVRSGALRMADENSAEQQRLEDNIYQDIVSAMQAEPKTPVVRKYRFAVVNGGKTPETNPGCAGVVHIDELRRARRAGIKLLQ